MVTVDAQGRMVEQPWPFISDDQADAPAENVILTASRLIEALDPNDDALAKIGVRLTVDDDLDAVAAYLNKISVIELEFPAFKDGRPFSTAVVLRRRYGYQGDLRAAGDFLPDQILFLVRAGFTSFAVPTQFKPEQVKASLAAYSLAYQPDIAGTVPHIGSLRHRADRIAAQ